MPASRTRLAAGVPSIGHDHLATAPGRLVFELPAQFVKAHVANGTRQASVAQHAFDVEVLDADRVKAAGDACAQLVQAIVADRWYPSSKTCSCCGHKLASLPLSVRQGTCQGCAAVHDRDVNAAINLKHMAESSSVAACGGAGAGLVREHEAKPAPAKQESNSKGTYR
jgi:putative transposase